MNSNDGSPLASQKKSTWSSTLFQPINSLHSATPNISPPAKSPEALESVSDGPWTLVHNDTSKSGGASEPVQVSATMKKKTVLAKNRFFVPPSMEKHLHQPQQQHGQEQNKLSAASTQKDNLRCFKRNQRRKRQRALKRAALAVASLKSEENTNAEKKGSSDLKEEEVLEEKEVDAQLHLLAMPDDISNTFLSFLCHEDLLQFGQSCKRALELGADQHLWHSLYQRNFVGGQLTGSNANIKWKLAFQMESTGLIHRLRCSYTKQTFFEDVLGCGVDFTVNPKTQRVDYINMSQDLLSACAFNKQKVRTDVFGSSFKLFLPLYFSEGHFEQALPQIKKTMVRLCPERKTQTFDPCMALDVVPKIMNTFIVLVSDEGISASRKSFYGLLRIHMLFLALAHRYPEIKAEALRRLRLFASKEEYRHKKVCPSLGNILPLVMIVDEKDFSWRNMCLPFLTESFDRAVLWICKANPKLERTCGPSAQPESAEEVEERIVLSREAMTVSMRLMMFHVYFLKACCKGTTQSRFCAYNVFFGRADAVTANVSNAKKGGEAEASEFSLNFNGLELSFERFNRQVSSINAVDTWQLFFRSVSARCPQSKEAMAQLLRQSVKNSSRKGYHRAGMDFSRVQASGTSQVLSKGQTYSASSDLRRVRFYDDWTFGGSNTVYLDATCLLYRGRTLSDTIDYRNTVLYQRHPFRRDAHTAVQAVVHSGDVMRADGGTHTIEIDLDALDEDVTSCIFVISAWNGARLADMTSTSISFSDANAGLDAAPLCTYHLDAQDKIAHLTSVIMCKLYRTKNGGWHVLAIGDAHRGSADNYGPIYSAVKKLL